MIKAKQKINRLTAIKFHHRNKHRNPFWLFQCDCGARKIINADNVEREKTKSCGCLRKEGNQNGATHRMFGTRIYYSWTSMKQRCLNPKSPDYKDYGGRGIKVCKRWMKFENFLIDMIERPIGKTLDRINNNGNYNKKNCKWSTPKEQANNKRIKK